MSKISISIFLIFAAALAQAETAKSTAGVAASSATSSNSAAVRASVNDANAALATVVDFLSAKNEDKNIPTKTLAGCLQGLTAYERVYGVDAHGSLPPTSVVLHDTLYTWNGTQILNKKISDQTKNIVWSRTDSSPAAGPRPRPSDVNNVMKSIVIAEFGKVRHEHLNLKAGDVEDRARKLASALGSCRAIPLTTTVLTKKDYTPMDQLVSQQITALKSAVKKDRLLAVIVNQALADSTTPTPKKPPTAARSTVE